MNTDTLTANAHCLDAWVRSGNYEYERQVTQPQRDLMGELFEKLYLRYSDFTSLFEEWSTKQVVAASLFAVGCVVALYLLWTHRYRWHRRAAGLQQEVNYEVHDDSIYCVDFEAEIKRTYAQALYGEVVRLAYLKHLRALVDAGTVNWSEGHTPDYYVLALPPGAQRTLLRRLTTEYVRVRFGHYAATRAQADEVLGWLEKGGEA